MAMAMYSGISAGKWLDFTDLLEELENNDGYFIARPTFKGRPGW